MRVSMDGEQQSTHASMPRVARRTRIRTCPLRRAARRGRNRKSCCHACTDVSVERKAFTSVGFVDRCTRASVEITRRPTNVAVGPTHALKVKHVFTRRSGHRSPYLAVCAQRRRKTRVVISKFVRANLCFFWFVPGGPCGALSTRCHSSCASETMLVFRGWCQASHLLGACVCEAL